MPTTRSTKGKSATSTSGTMTADRGTTNNTISTRGNASGTGTATATAAAVQLAMQSAQQLQQSFGLLNAELMSYNEPNVVGRNTILLKSYFDQIVGHLHQISSALKVNWQPPSTGRAGR